MAEARARLAVALDVPLSAAELLLPRIAEYAGVAKVGLSLFVEHGPRAVEVVKRSGSAVFLDLKLHDIPNTVELAATRAGALGVAYLTVHASGGTAMLQAAVRGTAAGAAAAGVAAPKILAVTVLTSMDAAGLAATGVSASPGEQAARLARLARDAGVHGFVCSASEVAALRAVVGPGLVLCTPGIRPAGTAKGDQARVETPAAAIAAGADLLVVGRPIYEAADPVAAARAIRDEIAAVGR